VLTTHYMEEAERLCDRVAIIDHGRAIALGTPRELVQSLGAEHVIEFALGGELALAPDVFARVPGVQGVRGSDGTWSLTVAELHVAVPAILAELAGRGATLAELRTHSATLEDVFVSLTGRHLREGA
jgi:ABC-2 type transport system ATP-binding protein